MKALKLVLVAMLVAGTMACLASAGTNADSKSKIVIHTTLAKALGDPGLKAAMQVQLNAGFLLGGDQPVYTASVNYKDRIYKITGSKEEWKAFFAPKWILPKKAKKNHEGS